MVIDLDATLVDVVSNTKEGDAGQGEPVVAGGGGIHTVLEWQK